MTSVERRKTYLVKHGGLQFRYLGLILTSIILPAFLISACLYYLIFYLLAEQLAIPESIAYNLLPVFNKINLILMFGIPIIGVLLLFLGLVISHRVAGPIYRLEKDLEHIAKGDFSKRVRIRQHDEFSFIVQLLNKVLDKAQEKTK